MCIMTPAGIAGSSPPPCVLTATITACNNPAQVGLQAQLGQKITGTAVLHWKVILPISVGYNVMYTLTVV